MTKIFLKREKKNTFDIFFNEKKVVFIACESIQTQKLMDQLRALLSSAESSTLSQIIASNFLHQQLAHSASILRKSQKHSGIDKINYWYCKNHYACVIPNDVIVSFFIDKNSTLKGCNRG